ncbi:class I SAM-dependent methyltransferase [Undibacterium luofuense]|uniref:class I SAM-dependent methyltransferase n=1 Tax=Undibacterium luofuense TaxID=2828733 RepID=UPI0030EFA35B
MKCRHCDAPLTHSFLDLGSAPPSNAYLRHEQLSGPESWLPLRMLVCDQCWLVQTEDFAGRELLFDADYAYFSSCSSSWLAHAKQFVSDAVRKLNLTPQHCVVEIAANDGYLLQFVQQAGIRCLGVEPTASTAAAAREKGIPVREVFFGRETARRLAEEGWAADLMVANNVLAHVPDINDFAAGFATLLKPTGAVSFEFPHLLNMVQLNQFDTAYHEHFSYLSLHAVQSILQQQGLQIFNVEHLTTHGGSLRVWAQHAQNGLHAVSDSVDATLTLEKEAGMLTSDFYTAAQRRAENAKNGLLKALIGLREQGLRVAAYGAAAKGNTLLNFAGVRPDLITCVADLSPGKQGKYLPGSRIPIVTPAQMLAAKPDVVLILPWNLETEITRDLALIREWGGRFAIAIPEWKIW